MVSVVQKVIFLGKSDERYQFQCIDVVSTDVTTATYCAAGMSLPGHLNKVHDLSPEAEKFIIETMLEDISPLRGKKKMLIIELTDFPLVFGRIDLRDQEHLNKDKSQFSKDIIKAWKENTDTKIPCVIVNLNDFFTGLKILQVNY